MARSTNYIAYEAATARLREAHEEEFRTLQNEERAKHGLKPLPSKAEREAARIKKLKEELAKLEGDRGSDA